jgi:putative sigma-54 modulation protein
MDKLEKYYDKVVSSDVYLKVEKTSDKDKIVEVKINVPGDDFMVKKQCKTLKKGLNYRQNLREIVVKRKEKMRTHI